MPLSLKPLAAVQLGSEHTPPVGVPGDCDTSIGRVWECGPVSLAVLDSRLLHRMFRGLPPECLATPLKATWCDGYEVGEANHLAPGQLHNLPVLELRLPIPL
jgi:hypothetical protein